jgi:hypothetical protein
MDSNVGHVNTGGNREDKLVIISRGGGVVSKQVRPQKCRRILAPLKYYKDMNIASHLWYENV